MKYQGFYDSVISDSGVADRPYTAKQFCMYMRGLLGSGIAITNATGDDAWKVEKTGNLALSVKLGNNSYNFASLNGNPFIVDEELSLIVSQGTNRWDSILIRADSTGNVRATDVIVQEGSTVITRNDNIYDLRLARVHIVNNVITEVIDDRFDNDYCGVANGLVTVPLDELRQTIEDAKDLSGVAFKDGNLQTNLNAEKVGGKNISNIMTDTMNLKTIVDYKVNQDCSTVTINNVQLENNKSYLLLVSIPEDNVSSSDEVFKLDLDNTEVFSASNRSGFEYLFLRVSYNETQNKYCMHIAGSGIKTNVYKSISEFDISQSHSFTITATAQYSTDILYKGSYLKLYELIGGTV